MGGDVDSDEKLMLCYKNGDADAFEILYRRHRNPLFRYLYRQVGNRSLTEELFQDVWMNLIRARERYKARAKFATLLYKIARNRVVDHYRSKKHAESQLEESVAHDVEIAAIVVVELVAAPPNGLQPLKRHGHLDLGGSPTPDLLAQR